MAHDGAVGLCSKVGPNFVALVAGDAVGKIAAMTSTVYIARTLGSADYGRLSFAMAFVPYLAIVVDAGLGTIASREIAACRDRDGHRLTEIIATVLSFRVLAASLIVLAFSLVVAASRLPHSTKLLWMGISLIGLAQGLNTEWAYRGLEFMLPTALASCLGQLCFLVLAFALVDGPTSLAGVPYLRFASDLTVFAIAFAFLVVTLGAGRSWRVRPGLWRAYLRDSYAVALAQLMIQLYYSFDVLLLGVTSSPATVGWYSSAYKIVMVFIGVRSMAAAALFPALARMWAAGKRRELAVLINALARLLLVAAVPAGILVTVFAADIVRLALGAGFAPAAVPLRILTWTVVVLFVNVSFPGLFNAVGRQDIYLRGHLVVVSMNVALNLLLTPRYGFGCAAAITLLCDIFSLTYFARKAHTTLGLAVTFADAVGPALVGGAALVAVLHLGKVSWISTAAGLSAYAAAVGVLCHRKLVEDVVVLRSFLLAG